MMMLELDVEPHQHVALRYPIPWHGWVWFTVTVDAPVSTYVVTDDGLAGFRRGDEEFRMYGGFTNTRRRLHQQTVQICESGGRSSGYDKWNLVIANWDKKRPVHVCYEAGTGFC